MNSHRTERFIKLFDRLPVSVQQRARVVYSLWKVDLWNETLHFKRVHSSKPFYSVRIGRDWRVVGRREEDTMIWFWIGSHSDYDQLLKQL